MTRKDYEAIAKALRKVRADRSAPNGGVLPSEVLGTIEDIEDALAGVFASDNPRFNRDRFVEACGHIES